MIKLASWYFSKRFSKTAQKDSIYAHGFVFNHPRFDDGTIVVTNRIQSIKYDKDNNRLIFMSGSNHEYELLLSSMLISDFDNIQEYLKEFDIVLDKEFCQNLISEYDSNLYNQIQSKIDCNSLYLQMAGSFVIHAFYKNGSGELYKVYPSYNSGMFVDNVLIIDNYKNDFNFEYYIRDFGIEPYKWSDNLNIINIENIGNNDFTVVLISNDNKDGDIICKHGEITSISYAQYIGDGLIS